ncbi:histamine N-methyltransferase-like [Ptychodera flava]|uniref:histamine N-methyltransferase-like n=1 Tax=Ptychodera flava TaxID=63121 RepID=UPI00396A2655
MSSRQGKIVRKDKMAYERKLMVYYEEEYFQRYKTTMKYALDLDDQQQKSRASTFSNFRKDSELCVLAIGTSNGIKDAGIINVLLSSNNCVQYVVVDPSKCAINEFKHTSMAKQSEGHWEGVKFTFHQKTIEEYLDDSRKTKEQSKFDIIHAQHCAYFFPDPGQVFLGLYELLNKGGLLLNALCFGAWERAAEEMAKYYPYPTMNCNGSATLRQILHRQMPDTNIQYFSRKFAIKVDECFKEESSDGNMILDFILQILDTRKNTPDRQFSEIMSFFKDQCCYTVDGELLFDGDEEDIVIIRE